MRVRVLRKALCLVSKLHPLRHLSMRTVSAVDAPPVSIISWRQPLVPAFPTPASEWLNLDGETSSLALECRMRRRRRRRCRQRSCPPRHDRYKQNCPQKVRKGYHKPCPCPGICPPHCYGDEACDPWAGTRRSCRNIRRRRHRRRNRKVPYKEIPCQCD